MKRFFLVIALAISSVAFVNAQSRAIGGRFGYGLDFSYQHSVGQNMVNIEIGAPWFTGVQVAATHDWIFPISSWQYDGSWNWYAGVGGAVGLGFLDDLDLTVGVAGRIGVEYNFAFPLQLSLDWRPIVGPTLDFGDGTLGFNTWNVSGVALGVRYNF